MRQIIFILIAVGLLWSSLDSSLNAFNSNSQDILSFEPSLSGELMEERTSDSQDTEREFYELDYLALNNISKKLLTLKLQTKTVDSPALLSFISPVFTPPPDIFS